MKWHLSLAAYSLGHRTAEFVTWFEYLIRCSVEPSSEDDFPCPASAEVTRFDSSRLRKLEVEIHRILHFLKTADHSDQLSARAKHAIEVVDRTFALCLRFGEGSLLSSEINAELKESLRWLEEFRGEADIKAWRRRSRKVSKIIRGIISEFTSCFADMGDAFSIDLRCFYQLGRGISEFHALLPRVQEVADNPLKLHLIVRGKLYPALLRLVKNCEVQAPAFSLKLDERIDDRDFYDFVFALHEAIETKLARGVKLESDRAKAKKTLQSGATGSEAKDTSATRTSTVSYGTDEPNSRETESQNLRGSETPDVPASELTEFRSASVGNAELDPRLQSQKYGQSLPRDEKEIPGSNRKRQRFKELDRGVEIFGVHVPVEGILKRVLVVLGTATSSAKDAQLRKAAAPAKEKKQSTSGIRNQRLYQLRKVLRTAFKLAKTTDPIPAVEESDPPEWKLDWQRLRAAARSLRPDN